MVKVNGFITPVKIHLKEAYCVLFVVLLKVVQPMRLRCYGEQFHRSASRTILKEREGTSEEKGGHTESAETHRHTEKPWRPDPRTGGQYLMTECDF